MRTPVEIPEQPEVTLAVVQTSFDDKAKVIKHAVQEMTTKSVDFMYNIGSAKIGVESFGKSFQANNDLLDPIIVAIGYKENLAEMASANEAYFRETVLLYVNNAICTLEERAQSIENSKFVSLNLSEQNG